MLHACACGRAEHFYARTHAHLLLLQQQREGEREGKGREGKERIIEGGKNKSKGIIRGNSKPHTQFLLTNKLHHLLAIL
jgi:hypothetical protein